MVVAKIHKPGPVNVQRLGPGVPGTLKLTAKAPENGWLEDEFPFGARPIFSCYVSFGEGTKKNHWVNFRTPQVKLI